MKPSHKIFFAIPFDSATKQLYERVAEGLRQRYKTLSTIIGTEEVGPSPSYSSIATFKAQNRELTEQFFKRIRDADLVVADLTHNNPDMLYADLARFNLTSRSRVVRDRFGDVER
jgi:hypothetical protein